jgi:uncharacterized protein
MALTRRQFLAGTGVALAAAATPGLYAWGPGRLNLSLVRHDVFIPDLPPAFQNFTIAQLSDFHFGPFDESSLVEHAVDLVNSLKPDLVALTGDFITADHDDNTNNLEGANACAAALSRLNCPLRYATLGNHDTIDPEGISGALESKGLTVLRNSFLPLDLRGDRVWLSGIADALFQHPNLKISLPDSIKEPVILLGHEPDFADKVVTFCASAKRRCDLFLTGHTHGGQINVPVVTRYVLPRHGQKYIQGPFQLGPTLLYVNRGLGTIHVPLRFNAPPEVTLFTLKA